MYSTNARILPLRLQEPPFPVYQVRPYNKPFTNEDTTPTEQRPQDCLHIIKHYTTQDEFFVVFTHNKTVYYSRLFTHDKTVYYSRGGYS